ncbi:ATP synthase F1 subunit gamma [bacterium]|nr:ATP synthase F1 subunit gamma [bacterium]
MPQASRDIQRRIKSVKNTKKITKAMELVSAAKMRKAVARVLASRSYADLVWDTVLHLVKKVDTDKHPFFVEPQEVKKVAVVLVSTNRGLCGSFNSQLVNKVLESIKIHHPETTDTDIISCGTKGRDEARRRKVNLVADFHKEDITASSEDIRPIAHMITQDFLAKKYDKVFLAFTDFQSSLKQVPHVKQLLPIVPEIDERLGHITHEKDQVENINVDNFAEFIFEPGVRSVLDAFLPRLVEVQIYQSVLESEASEHSARMFAMRNATDAAGDMIDELTLAYNQARQAGITGEIAEIAAGSAALE